MGNNFDKTINGFCEGTIYGHPPEYLNSFTSIFITIVGAIGLFGSINTDICAKILYSGMVVNGIGSFGYHWTNYMGWRYLDEFSMLLIVLGGFISILVSVSQKFNIGKRVNAPLKQFYSNAIYSVLFLVIITHSVASFTLDTLDNVIGFRILFGSFLLITAISFIIISRDNKIIYNSLTNEYDAIPKYIIRYNYIGIITITIASLMWMISELLCGVANFEWIKYIPGHAIWHIGLAIGGFYLVQYNAYVNATYFGDKHCAEFITSTWYYKLLPRVDYRYLQESFEYII